ncbi:MAG: pentapeptide repeat-containing protein [Methanocorpusculum sp.]|nr:pentapeptide repeat-containing protein [Methanocorpusculum sp.]
MVERPEGWNKELYDKLSFDFLIECAKKDKIEEWNQAYEAYLKSEWERLIPNQAFDIENIVNLPNFYFKWIFPIFRDKDITISHPSVAKFSRAILIGADFRLACLKDADYWGARLDGTNFIGVHLENADFRLSYLKKAQFNVAFLDGAQFSESQLAEAKFTWAHLNGADFYQARLEGANFGGADIEDAIFRETQLKRANFNGANLKRTDFSGAQLEKTYFCDSHLEGACLDIVNLRESQFNRSHLEGTEFRGGQLEGVDFTYAVVNGKTLFSDNTIDDKTDFTGTNLSVVRINPKLRKHLERNIRKLNITNKNVFVAMKFDCPDLDSALKNAIKPACLECGGLEACTVNEKAGDGWIPQRIKEEIQDARFVISDLTYRNPGVYYETGYADGLEIPVIQTCNKSWYDKDPAPLHFDIAQRNTIFWNDDNDLKQQLIMKIKELQENGK